MQPVNVGVIGFGYWGPNLVRNFFELPSSKLIAVADLQDSRLDHVRTRYPGVRVTHDYADLFDMPLDAAVVATPPATHHEIAMRCLEHNLNVFVEKPLTLNSKDAEALIDAAAARFRQAAETA